MRENLEKKIKEQKKAQLKKSEELQLLIHFLGKIFLYIVIVTFMGLGFYSITNNLISSMFLSVMCGVYLCMDWSQLLDFRSKELEKQK